MAPLLDSKPCLRCYEFESSDSADVLSGARAATNGTILVKYVDKTTLQLSDVITDSVLTDRQDTHCNIFAKQISTTSPRPPSDVIFARTDN